jgi:hypothetical protein
MNVALPIEQADRPVAEKSTSSLESRVQKAIAAHTEFDADLIYTQDNRVKYHNAGKLDCNLDHLYEVFQLMKDLNEAGLHSDMLGRLSADGLSFRDALRQSCSLIAKQLKGRSLVYVELGPEPVKTGFVIRTLLDLGVVIDRYVAVDINPTSSPHMRQALTEILPAARLDFVTTSFDSFRLGALMGDDPSTAIITMLGFQEGNDDPFIVNEWLRAIARPGDLLLSESQLFDEDHGLRISEFYANPLMQAICHAVSTLNHFLLLPVAGATAYAAILGEEFTGATGARSLSLCW